MRVGVLGGGQLARMMALAGHPLGLEFAFLDPAPDACAFPLGHALRGAYDDPARLDELADFFLVSVLLFHRSRRTMHLFSQSQSPRGAIPPPMHAPCPQNQPHTPHNSLLLLLLLLTAHQ